MTLYQKGDFERVQNVNASPEDSYRSPFARDYSRLIHSPAFRRLVGKTQLFPGRESDFFRNRLTHSIEVSDIAKAIAEQLNKSHFNPKNPNECLNLDLVKFSALAHDIGHPPFGHNGEKALDLCMMTMNERFEGNAHTLRILTRLEKKELLQSKKIDKLNPLSQFGVVKGKGDFRIGLNLTYRSLASIIKYGNELKMPDKKLSKNDKEELKDASDMSSFAKQFFKENEYKLSKGYFKDNHQLVKDIKKYVAPNSNFKAGDEFKTIECYIMDLADDISYTTYDLEDTIHAGFVNLLDFFIKDEEFFSKILAKLNDKIDEANVKKIHEGSKPIDKLSDLEALQNIYSEIFRDHIPPIKPTPELFKRIKNKDNSVALSIITYFHTISESIKKNGYSRTIFSTELVKYFISNIVVRINDKETSLSKVFLKEEAFIRIEALKIFISESQVQSPKLQIVEVRGKEIIKKIFFTLLDGGHKLLPLDFKTIYENVDKGDRARVICDFIAGMTDSYAIEFYGRLTSENPETIFKPY